VRQTRRRRKGHADVGPVVTAEADESRRAFEPGGAERLRVPAAAFDHDDSLRPQALGSIGLDRIDEDDPLTGRSKLPREERAFHPGPADDGVAACHAQAETPPDPSEKGVGRCVDATESRRWGEKTPDLKHPGHLPFHLTAREGEHLNGEVDAGGETVILGQQSQPCN